VDRYGGLWNPPVSEPSAESSILTVRYPAAWAASVAKHSTWVDAAFLCSYHKQSLQYSVPSARAQVTQETWPPDGGMGAGWSGAPNTHERADHKNHKK
jgi:hypothetical protein